jgi:tripartite-type tricarboxylate transporter receptor subunit TctC
MIKVLNQPDIRKKLAAIGATVVANSPDEFTANVQGELGTWVKVIRETGIKAE